MLNEKIAELYDKRMYEDQMVEYFGDSDFHNYGYWTENTKSQAKASANLVEKLLSFIPEKNGSILDVACGMGASTRLLHKYYDPSEITGINISEKQLETCRKNAPQCTFLQMDAVKLAFEPETFQSILCVEAVFHFNTRQDFFKEAHRVLKQGGTLVLSDIIPNRMAVKMSQHIPNANMVKDFNEYREILSKAGFHNIKLIDSTAESWHGFNKSFSEWKQLQYRQGKITLKEYLMMKMMFAMSTKSIKNYFLVAATKS